MAKTVWESGVTSIPAPTGSDPDWYEVTHYPATGAATLSGGVDFIWGGTTKDHSWLLRSAPVVSGSGEIGWQFIFRRPTSGSYSVRMYALDEDGT